MECDICYRVCVKFYLINDCAEDKDILLCRFCNKIYNQYLFLFAIFNQHY